MRRVPLSEKARKIIAGRISRFDGDYLFPHNDIDGKQPTGSLVHIHLKTIRTLGFNFRIYGARHTFAIRAIEDGVDLTTVAAILGHANLKMLHVTLSRQKSSL